MEIEWDAIKAADNLRKHRVGFEEAATAFGDPLALTFDDPDNSDEERRFLTFGVSDRSRLLIISHTYRRRRVRIISARRVDRGERRIYEEG